MSDNFVLKHLILGSLYLLILFSTYAILPPGVFATRSSFPNVKVSDPPDDWTYTHTKKYLGLSCYIAAPDNRTLCIDRQPISVEECKIRDPLTEKLIFASPDITSISYTSDGNILNATAWLKHAFGPNMGNSTDIPSSFTVGNVSQPSFSLIVIDGRNKDLGKAIEEHIELMSRNLTAFRLDENLSGSVNIQGDPAYKIVYTYRGDKADVCDKCVETDVMTIKDGKLYLFMFWGEDQRYNELISTAMAIINSTNIGFQQYENPARNIQMKYPRDWNRIEDSASIGFTPPQNRTDGLLEGVRISSDPIEYDISLEEYSNLYSDRLASLSNFSLINSKIVTLPEHQAYRINYTYLLESNLQVAASTIIMQDGGTVYTVEFGAEKSRYPSLIPLVDEMLESLRIEEIQDRPKNQETISSNDIMYVYENSTYRLRFEYPHDWLEDEKDFLTNPEVNGIISLYSSTGKTFRLSIDHNPGVFQSNYEQDLRNNLEVYLKKTIQSYKSSTKDFRLIYNSSDSWLSDRPAYILEFKFRDRDSGLMMKAQERGVILYHNKVIRVMFFSELEEFSNYLPVVQGMMNSLEFEIPTLKYRDSYFEIEYPDTWTRPDTLPYPLSVPQGYYLNQNEIFNSVASYSPIDIPYYIFKGYRVDFDYDYTYKRAGNNFPFTVEYSASRNLTPEGSAILPNWTKFIAEIQGENKRIIINSTRDDDGLINEDKGYVYWSINLDSLNLPNQFYITFRAVEAFIKDGQLCTLVDDTDFVGSPPPEYSMVLSPGTIQDIRPNEERNVKVDVKTNSTLPFLTTFSAKEEDLEFVFEPNKVPGAEGGITTSNLKIKALPNATGNKQHTFTIHANIFLTPTFNPSNATSANISKTSDFTITVLPAKELGEQINEAWSKFGSSLSGFGGLLATILAIVGTAGGWILAKRKSKQEHSANTNNNKPSDSMKRTPI